MDFLLLLPLLAGLSFALGNFFIKLTFTEIGLGLQSFLNLKFLLGLSVGLVGFLLLLYCLKTMELWKVVLVVNVVATLSAVLLGFFLLNEPISLVRWVFVLLTITFLAATILTS